MKRIATTPASGPDGVPVRMRLLAKWTPDGEPVGSADAAAETPKYTGARRVGDDGAAGAGRGGAMTDQATISEIQAGKIDPAAWLADADAVGYAPCLVPGDGTGWRLLTRQSPPPEGPDAC